MVNIEELRTLKPWELTKAVEAFLVTVAPGVLILYLYRPALVTELASLKLIVFSASLTLPLVAINTFLFVVIDSVTMKRLKNVYPDAFWSGLAVWCSTVLYSTTLVAYLCALPFKNFLITLAIINFVVGVPSMYLTTRFIREHP